jgi:hypothetical protein
MARVPLQHEAIEAVRLGKLPLLVRTDRGREQGIGALGKLRHRATLRSIALPVARPPLQKTEERGRNK